MLDAGLIADPDAPALEFDVRESEYVILRQSRERWIGPRTLEREARISLAMKLTEPGTDDPVWSYQGKADRAEEVASNRIPSSAGYPKAAGTTAVSARKLNPYLEPVIVGGIVTGLAVIFFSNRNVGN